jgi:hypothetical protein
MPNCRAFLGHKTFAVDSAAAAQKAPDYSVPLWETVVPA